MNKENPKPILFSPNYRNCEVREKSTDDTLFSIDGHKPEEINIFIHAACSKTRSEIDDVAHHQSFKGGSLSTPRDNEYIRGYLV